jgi:carbon-monoxide dehydrogenase large subunit
MAQVVGQAFNEQLVCDERAGGLLFGSLMDHGLPHPDEVASFELDVNTVLTKTNVLGVEGAGEAGSVGALAAIINAVAETLSPVDIAHINMPATPERVWYAIRAAGYRALNLLVLTTYTNSIVFPLLGQREFVDRRSSSVDPSSNEFYLVNG